MTSPGMHACSNEFLSTHCRYVIPPIQGRERPPGKVPPLAQVFDDEIRRKVALREVRPASEVWGADLPKEQLYGYLAIGCEP